MSFPDIDALSTEEYYALMKEQSKDVAYHMLLILLHRLKVIKL